MKAIEEILYILCSAGLSYSFIGIYKALVGLNNGGKLTPSYLGIIILIPAVILQHTTQMSYSLICLDKSQTVAPYPVLIFLSISWMILFAIVATVFPPYRTIEYNFEQRDWRNYAKSFRRVLYFFSFFYVLSIFPLKWALGIKEAYVIIFLRIAMLLLFVRAIIMSYKITIEGLGSTIDQNDEWKIQVYLRFPWIKIDRKDNSFGFKKTILRRELHKIDCYNTSSIASYLMNKSKHPSNYRSKPFDLAHAPGNNSANRLT